MRRAFWPSACLVTTLHPVTGLTRSPRLVGAVGSILLWLTAGAILALWFTRRIRDWSVMTDELQYVKLALSVAETHSPLPAIHGASVAASNQLYPLLLAPVVGPLSAPDAFQAAHVLNAFLMTSAAIPAYLLGRELLDRTWSLVVAVSSVVMPWMVLTGVLMSEAAAYPAFLWATLALYRAIVEPSPRRDLLASAALGLALLARTQFAILLVALPIAILVHETVSRAAEVDGVRARLAAGAGSAARGHRVIWGVYAAGIAVALATALAGHRLLGAYETTVEEGSPLPSGVWVSALRHVDTVGIGCGLLPLLLGGGWLLAAVLRPLPRDRHAYATLATVTVAGLALQTASFDLRFGGPEIIRDRYLFYVVPLLLVASAAALTEDRRRPVAVGVVAVTAVVAATAHGLPFPTFPGLSFDTPVSILNETLIEQSGSLGTGTFVALTALLLGGVLALSLVIAPRLPLALVFFAAVLCFSTLVLRSEVDRVLGGTSLTGRPLAGPPGVVLDWVDAVVPEDAEAAIVAFPISTAWGVSAIQWWDVEFWNRRITRSYVARDGNFTYTTFPQGVFEIDPVSGVVAGTADAPRYVIAAEGDPRFQLAGSEYAANVGLVVLDAVRPYRAVWSSLGLRTDGWTRPGVPATIRVHPRPGLRPEVASVHIRISAPPTAAARYRVSAPTANRVGEVAPGASADEVVLLCAEPSSPVDVSVAPSTSARIEGPPLEPEPGPDRLVGVLIGPVAVRFTGRPCTT